MARQLAAAGARIRRVGEGENWIPMHDKFALVETQSERRCVFGSFNWSERSRRASREIGVISADETLFKALEQRWEELGQHASRMEQDVD
jgi:phosphatidylserine/phosphatidylglycerophosphate/cardiolipin synthase-like enzyme